MFIGATFRFKHERFYGFGCLGAGEHAHMRAVGRVTVTFMVDTLMCVAASVLEADLDKLEEEVEHGYLDVECVWCFFLDIYVF